MVQSGSAAYLKTDMMNPEHGFQRTLVFEFAQVDNVAGTDIIY